MKVDIWNKQPEIISQHFRFKRTSEQFLHPVPGLLPAAIVSFFCLTLSWQLQKISLSCHRFYVTLTFLLLPNIRRWKFYRDSQTKTVREQIRTERCIVTMSVSRYEHSRYHYRKSLISWMFMSQCSDSPSFVCIIIQRLHLQLKQSPDYWWLSVNVEGWVSSNQ